MSLTTRKRPSRRPSELRPERPPLTSEEIERLALHYTGRYATSRSKLVAFLKRKLRARGWKGEEAPDVLELAERLAALGYIDDRAFADARARSLSGRGFGKGRVRQALKAAGINEEDAESAHQIADEGRWAAALHYAEKRRIGPWALTEPDRAGREKAIASMIRGGHDFAAARVIASAHPGQMPEDVSN